MQGGRAGTILGKPHGASSIYTAGIGGGLREMHEMSWQRGKFLALI
jgi:hypothetical protein